MHATAAFCGPFGSIPAAAAVLGGVAWTGHHPFWHRSLHAIFSIYAEHTLWPPFWGPLVSPPLGSSA
uniref:Putative secreted protein n=1 Tax=Anopheles darlingi TaxID=43151 RepID=A0A2M4DG95_ANODA